MIHVALLALTLSASPYQIDLLTDGLVTGGSLSLMLLSEAAVKPTLAGGLACNVSAGQKRCNKSDLLGIDAWSVGDASKGWGAASDHLAIAAYGLPLLIDALDYALSPNETLGADYGKDVLVMAESVAVASFASQVFKMAVRRPRPAQYDEHRSVKSVENQLSFPSGHVTSVSAMVASYGMTFWLRHPDSPWRFVVVGAGAAMTAATAYGRVAGGMHFVTDTLAGAVLGSAVGLLVPYVHRHNIAVQVDVTSSTQAPSIKDYQLLVTMPTN